MTKKSYLLFCVLGMLHGPLFLVAGIEYDPLIPQMAFAAQELKDAVKDSGRDELEVALVIRPHAVSPESFEIRSTEPSKLWIIGTDANGAMYGGLEVANLLRLGLPINNQEQSPFVGKRGIKFNLSLDVRTPSYDDSGDSAQNSIETIWDFQFWKAFLDDLARYRYNVLSLWSAHPYPSFVKLEEYPDVALEDVYRLGLEMEQDWRKSGNPGPWGPWDRNLGDPGTLKLVKKITIDEKIAYWQRVFQYAEDRGIEIYLFHWNVFTLGATGKHGITQVQTNHVTVDYLRKSVLQALLTYPQIKGIGVTAGENADNYAAGENSIESFLFHTYGQGIMDVLAKQPDRKIRFIFRRHQTGLGPITDAFATYPCEIETSYKYAIDRIYSMRRPVLFEQNFRAEVENYGLKCWLHLRNDDIFVLRWGNPDYVRDYIQKMPHHLSPGFYMGSDGYVWAREFVARNPEMAGRLEIDKHWYKFRLWGQLAYNPSLGRDYWEAVLEHRFPGVDGNLLYGAWAVTSEIVPQINRACYNGVDAFLSPEGCISLDGFVTLDYLFFNNSLFKPMPGSGIHSVTEWGKAVVTGQKLTGITPLQVADNLDTYAAAALAVLPDLRKQVDNNVEFEETLNDIASMAYLGRYYADKIRAGAKLAVFREDRRRSRFNEEAVGHLKDAVEEWKAYAAITSSQYKPQLLARTDFLDWNRILTEVEKEVVAVQNEADYPDVQFANLKNGERFPHGTDLLVKVNASDKDGIREVKLFLNGLLLKAHAEEPQIWSNSSDELLAALKPGIYHLEVVAEDNTGILSRRDIQVIVGDGSPISITNWRDEIHQVILNDGERLMAGEVRVFPRLECYFAIDHDGRMTLNSGTPHMHKGVIWNMWGRKVGFPHFATIENGQLVTCSGTSGQPVATFHKTPPVTGSGPFSFGITVSKKLVLFRELEKGEREILWSSN